jgi:protein O-mannosyl-transferase
MITADRYMYLSMAGFGLVSAWFIYQLYLKYKKYRIHLVVVCSIWFLFLGGQSFYHTTLWKNSETIKKKAQEEFYRMNPAYEPPASLQKPLNKE